MSINKNSANIIIEEKITKVNGEIAVKKYLRGELLGKGGFAKCYEATNMETKKIYAVKVIQKASLNKNRAKQKLLSEIKIHKSLHHDYIVQFENCFEDSDHVYIFLELCVNKTLSEMLKKRKKLTVKESKYFMIQLLQAVKYMHTNRIIHRDLKMGNIFLNQNMELKVGDFGLATKLQFADQKKRTVCGTPNYIAPQIIQGTVGHSYQVDIWSCGVICFALLFGKPPFETNEVKATYAKIKVCKYDFPDISIPQEAKDFIKKILVLDPKKRLTIDELFEHPFIKKQEDIPKYLPVEALNDVPNFKNIGNVDQVIKKKESTGKLRPLDFGKKKPQQQFLGLCTSPRNVGTNMNQKMTERIGGEQKTERKPQIKSEKTARQTETQIYVITHVDYSSKYGLGYILNNGNYGVYFNDSSKINFDPENQEVTFIAKPEQNRQQQISKFTTGNIPKVKDLQKKYSLLQHFKYYLDVQTKNKNFQFQNIKKMVYMKQWLKTKHAIMFRLSNKVFQVDFLDTSQILLNTEKKIVTFTNKKGQKNYYSLNDALNSTETEMARRIKYTKQILNSIKKNNEDQPIEMNQKS